MEEDLTGRVVGSYRVEARIGAGGMGEVYRAHDAKLDRPVALKLLSSAVAADADRLRRFPRRSIGSTLGDEPGEQCLRVSHSTKGVVEQGLEQGVSRGSEWMRDGDAAPREAVLQVLRQQQPAACIRGSGNDHGVPNG
jgi:serine/threonine protein kinase